jgi:hypothetical protein
MNFYVYAIVDPRDMEPFYIGKGSGDRMYVHIRPSRIENRDCEKNDRITEILASDNRPIFNKLHINLDENSALNLEAKIIENIGLENLTNITPGGVGWKHSEESKKKMGDYQRGLKKSEETKMKMSIAQLGEKNWQHGGGKGAMLGKNHTEETNKKMSVAQSGKNNPRFGKNHTEETKKKMSEARKKWWKEKKQKEQSS